MSLTVGELARRCGLTVRTLHHYDTIGLLKPSLRSDAGYRLYDRANIERLHRIQALRQLGLSLADIGTVLSEPEQPLAELVDRQIAQLDHELAQASRLRNRLAALRGQLATGQSPDLADWLDTLELMTMYEKYFSPEELKNLPLHSDPDVQAQWGALVGEVKSAMDRGVAPTAPQAHALALHWMEMIQRGTGFNPAFLTRLKAMQDNEPELRARNGITPELQQFIEQALVSARLAIFERYLLAPEMERMRANYGKQMHDWPPLVAQLRSAMNTGTAPADPHAQQLAQRWMELFRAYAGDDPATHARIREAYANEPDLRSGSSIDPAMLAYVRQAIDSTAQRTQ
jgi:DNA-binding transcriptional MerR regulator